MGLVEQLGISLHSLGVHDCHSGDLEKLTLATDLLLFNGSDPLEFSFLLDGCDVVAEGDCRNHVSNNCRLLASLRPHMAVVAQLVVVGGAIRVLLARVFEQIQKILLVLFDRVLRVLGEDLFTDHVVLGQRAGLVGDQKLDAAQVFGDV